MSGHEARKIRSGPLKEKLGGVSDMTLYRWQRDRGFPKPIMLGGVTKFWNVDEVDAWMGADAETEPVKKPQPTKRAG